MNSSQRRKKRRVETLIRKKVSKEFQIPLADSRRKVRNMERELRELRGVQVKRVQISTYGMDPDSERLVHQQAPKPKVFKEFVILVSVERFRETYFPDYTATLLREARHGLSEHLEQHFKYSQYSVPECPDKKFHRYSIICEVPK